MRAIFLACLALCTVLLIGCASVPLDSPDRDARLKLFEAPPEGYSGVYVYRNSFIGQAVKRSLILDGFYLGKTANKVYFYKLVEPGRHVLMTESEFKDETLIFETEAGKNYFFEQYITMGLFKAGSNVRAIYGLDAINEIRQCKLARDLSDQQ